MPTEQEKTESSYIAGSNRVWLTLLKQCLRELGYDALGDEKLAQLITEREEALLALRRACAEHGDLEWPDELHLADVIEKHLVRHLDASE